MLGASAVWIGTRFVLSAEAGAPKAHQEAVRTSGFDDNIRTIIFTGRPLRVRNNEYIRNWEENRQAEIKTLTDKGVIPVRFPSLSLPPPFFLTCPKRYQSVSLKTNTHTPQQVEHDFETKGDDLTDDDMENARPFLMGKAAAVVNEKKTAREIVDEFVYDAVKCLQMGNGLIVSQSKL